jgi:O-antigen/teichoic acid export membrane protein
MKNPQKESLPSLQQRRRLRDFLTGAEHEAVKMPQRRRLRDFLTGAEHEAVKMPQHRRLRDFLTGTGYKAVKMPQPDGGERSRESSLTDETTAKRPAVRSVNRPGELTEKTSAVRAVKRSQETPAPLNIVPVSRRDVDWSVRRSEQKPTSLNAPRGQQSRGLSERHKQTWKPGTFGFNASDDVDEDDPDFEKFATIPVMVLRGISKQQGSSEPAMKSEISDVAGSAAFVGVGNIGGSFLKYGSNVVIQRGLGASSFGLYSLAMAIINLATAIFNLGLDDAMVRYTSIYRTRRQMGPLRGLMIFCTGIAGVAGILGSLLVLYYAPFLANMKHSPEMTPLLQALVPLIPLTCLQTIWISGLQGFKEFRWRVLIQRILIPISLIVLLLIGVILSPSLNTVVIVTLINAAIGVVLSLFFFLRKVSEVMGPEREHYDLREWFGFASPNFLTSVVDTVLESVDTLLLAYFAISNVELARYAAALKLSGFILMPQASFNAMFAPIIAELHSLGEKQKLEAMFKIVTKWAITFSLPIFGIMVLFSRSLLGISGEAFVAAWPLVIAFALGSMINVSTGSVGYVLLMTGHQRLSFLNSLTAVVVNVVLGYILAPRYGAMGVAIATGLAVGVVNIMRLLQVRLLVKMQPYNWTVLKPLGAVLISGALTEVLLYFLNQAHLSIQISHFHLSFELGLVPVFLAIYFGLLYLFKVGPEDKIVLDALSRKFRRGKKKKNKKR